MTCAKCNSAMDPVSRKCKPCTKAWHTAHYQRPEVKARHREQGRRWREANKQRQREMDLRSRLKTVYKMTTDQYEAMLAQQGHGCAICGSSDPKRKNALRLFVDHDHATGEVRGLLCHPCNLLIGHAEERPDVLQKAIEYVSKRRQEKSFALALVDKA